MKRINLILFTLLPLQFSVSCSEFLYSENDPGKEISDSGYLPDGGDGLAFRLDVLASQSIDDLLLDETFLVSAGQGENMTLTLSPTATVSGQLTGFDVSPNADITLPGEVGGISGIVRAWVPNTVMDYSARIEQDGFYDLPIVPNDNYIFSWTPAHDVALPFYVDAGVPIARDVERNVNLSWDESIPIYGQVYSDEANPLNGIRIQIYDRETGAIGPSTETSEIGTYNLRLYPGDYDVELSGQGDEGVPTLTQQISVFESDVAVDSANNLFADTQTIKADGRVVDPTGVPASGVLVRFTALSVIGSNSVSLVSESTTGSNGRFSIPVLKGSYQVEFIPPHEKGFSPEMITEVLLEDNVTELPTVNLATRGTINGQVLDALGEPAEGVILRAEEMGFNNVVYQAVTAEDGSFSLELSDTKMFWTLMPFESSQGAITFGQGFPSDWDDMIVQLRTGQPINGCVVHEDGEAAFAPIELRSTDGHFYGSTFTDQEGCFDLRIDLETQSPDSRQ